MEWHDQINILKDHTGWHLSFLSVKAYNHFGSLKSLFFSTARASIVVLTPWMCEQKYRNHTLLGAVSIQKAQLSPWWKIPLSKHCANWLLHLVSFHFIPIQKFQRLKSSWIFFFNIDEKAHPSKSRVNLTSCLMFPSMTPQQSLLPS